MSRYDYIQSIYIHQADYTFEAIIMAAMRKANSDQLDKLQDCFPDIWHELKTIYETQGGFHRTMSPEQETLDRLTDFSRGLANLQNALDHPELETEEPDENQT